VDLVPVNPGHLLVVPTLHAVSLLRPQPGRRRSDV
jgi:diadenosine tetraphosphate (Ap4A) HIT family hydrolase